MKKFNIESFLILTNPLSYVWAILYVIWVALKQFINITGIEDMWWYYTKFPSASEKVKEGLIVFFDFHKKKKTWMCWLKRYYWKKAYDEIKNS